MKSFFLNFIIIVNVLIEINSGFAQQVTSYPDYYTQVPFQQKVVLYPSANDVISGLPNQYPSIQSIYCNPTHGVAVLQNDTICYTPNANYCGIDTLYYIACYNGSCDSSVVYLEVCGLNYKQITGYVYKESNNNCTKNNNETVFANIPLRVEILVVDSNGIASPRIINRTTTSSNGYYKLFIGTSDDFKIVLPNELVNGAAWRKHTTCFPTTSFVNAAFPTNQTINFPITTTAFDCPLLQVDMGSLPLQRCSNNTFTIYYQNQGASVATNAYVEVTLDANMQYISSSIPAIPMANNVLKFQVGDVDILQKGTITLETFLVCNTTTVGQTHCVKAVGYPHTTCGLGTQTGIVQLTGTSTQDSIYFTIENIGGVQTLARTVTAYEDHIIFKQIPISTIEPNTSITIGMRNEHKSYRLEVPQDSNVSDLVAEPFPSFSILPVNGSIDLSGQELQFPNADQTPFTSILCQQSIVTTAGNNSLKIGYPLGVGEQHIITPTTDINYTIYFKNPEQEEAHIFDIVDKIDTSHLDIHSIQIGASSHAFEPMYTNNTITFSFKNAVLQPNEQGFVNFTIAQKANNPLGTIINNNAQIYYHAMSAMNTVLVQGVNKYITNEGDTGAHTNIPSQSYKIVETNTTTHEIGELNRGTTKVQNADYSAMKLYPNPTTNDLYIPKEFATGIHAICMYDIAGNCVVDQLVSSTNMAIKTSNLATGIYYYIATDKKGTILSQGKISKL